MAARDPVCGMPVDPATATYSVDLRGGTYYFSNKLCRDTFVEGEKIAYFSMEIGIESDIPTYSGGLGVLAGDVIRSSADLLIPMVAVTLVNRKGYVRQRLTPEGDQIDLPDEWDPKKHMRELPERVSVRIGDANVAIRAWLYDYWSPVGGLVPVLFLDTDLAENRPEDRGITDRLYTGDREYRLKRAIVLGIGGARMLAAQGIRVGKYHINESHSSLLTLELLRQPGMDEERVQTQCIFTTHTPVPAAHDVFPEDLMAKYFRSYCASLNLSWDEFMALGEDPHNPGDGFNMTAFALRMSRFHNGVSQKHGEVAREMWQPLWPDLPAEKVPIDAITNGVHMPSWLNHRIEALFDRYMDSVYPNWREDYDNPAIWEVVDEVADAELWREHQWLKMKLFARIRERKRLKWATLRDEPANLAAEGLMLDTSALTIGFARRFAEYKRADLIFEDLDRLDRIVNNRWRPVQFIFAGKAHPADERGKSILQKIYQYAQDPRFGGRIAFVEDYGEQLARYMVHGVDVWMNTPVPLMEASGTSGMKAGMNGVLNLSVLDGWWVEGYNGRNGWGIEGHGAGNNRPDAEILYDLIENEIAPLYYSRTMDDVPHKWVRMMKESIKSIAPQYCALRMLKDYVTHYYPSVCMYAAGPARQTAGLEEACPVGPVPKMR